MVWGHFFCCFITHKIYWDLTRFSEILQDLLKSHKIYRDLKRSLESALCIWHLTFICHCHDIRQLSFDIWHLTFDIDMPWHLTFDISEGTDSTSTDAHDFGTIPSHFNLWILRLSAISKKELTDSVNNIGLRDASASKNHKNFTDHQVQFLNGFAIFHTPQVGVMIKVIDDMI